MQCGTGTCQRWIGGTFGFTFTLIFVAESFTFKEQTNGGTAEVLVAGVVPAVKLF